MCPHPKKEIDVRISYQGITLGYAHLECIPQIISQDASTHMRDEDMYNIWSPPKTRPDGGKIKYSEPCINSFYVEPPEEEAGV